MKKLLEFIVKGIIEEGDYEISEKEDDGQYILEIKVKPEATGLLIGKGGQTIKSIQDIIAVRARKENKSAFLISGKVWRWILLAVFTDFVAVLAMFL